MPPIGHRHIGAGLSHGYAKLGRLASGGMGYVDLAARQEGRFRRLYAVKRMHARSREEPDARAMFFEEGRLAGLLRHPNVVSVLDVGEDDSGPYLVMEYVDGTSLGVLIGLARRAERHIPVQLCVRVALDVARGLEAAHNARDHGGAPLHLVHRDISPHNVLIGCDGTARITDFGVAKALGRRVHTADHVVKGKIAYMAPERFRFEEPEPRIDLYALGVVMWEVLSLRRLHGGNLSAVPKIVRGCPEDIASVRPDVPRELAALVMSLLAKDPASRPPDAGFVASWLEQVLAAIVQREGPISVAGFLREVAGRHIDETRRRVTAEPTGRSTPLPLTPPPRRGRGSRTLSVALAVALAGACAVGVFAMRGGAVELSPATERGPALADDLGERPAASPNAVAAGPEPAEVPMVPMQATRRREPDSSPFAKHRRPARHRLSERPGVDKPGLRQMDWSGELQSHARGARHRGAGPNATRRDIGEP